MSYMDLGIPEEIFQRPAKIYEEQYDCEVVGRTYIIDECFTRIFESERKDFPADRPYRVSPYKMAGILCFWIRKLKPFSVPENEEANRFVNETIALYSALYLVLGCQKSEPKIDGTYIHDLIVALRYNSFSPHSTAYLFESLFR
ncbi:MAG: hypothetical protein K2N07_04715 [Desulfovibrio sp.]|nr:hypothetical protein [Desulfovibrio sp.]